MVSIENPSNRTLSPATLLAFVRSAESGSFAAAAKKLDMSPAAVGQAVQRLEGAFGVKLLDRTTRRMSMTTDGQMLLERCRGLVGELDAITRLFDESRGVVRGPLLVSAPAGLARRYVLPLVARFVRAHPEVDVSLDASDTIRDFGADRVDVAFRILRPRDSSVIARRLARLRAVTVASPEYLRRHGKPTRPQQIAEQPWVVYRHPATGELAPALFRFGARDVAMHPPASMSVNDVDTACEAAAMGLGIAQPPHPYVAPYIAAGRLIPILERFVASPWTLYLCYASSKHLPLRVRAFVQFVRAEPAHSWEGHG